MENKILVIYVGVSGVRSEDIPDFIHKVTSKITPQTFEGEIIVIPTQSPNTTIECINPIYITEEKLILKHMDMIKNLQKELNFQLEILKEQNKLTEDE